MSGRTIKKVMIVLLGLTAIHLWLLSIALSRPDWPVEVFSLGTGALLVCLGFFLVNHLLERFLRRSKWTIAPETAQRNARICLAVAPVLELLPFGGVLNSGPPEEPTRALFSYFDPRLFGMLNPAPLLTGLMTIYLLSATKHILEKRNGNPNSGEKQFVLHIVAQIFSVLPWVLLGASYISVCGVLITLLLTASTCFLVLATREN